MAAPDGTQLVADCNSPQPKFLPWLYLMARSWWQSATSLQEKYAGESALSIPASLGGISMDSGARAGNLCTPLGLLGMCGEALGDMRKLLLCMVSAEYARVRWVRQDSELEQLLKVQAELRQATTERLHSVASESNRTGFGPVACHTGR